MEIVKDKRVERGSFVVLATSLISYILCASAFYTEASYLENNGLGGSDTLLDQFLRFSTLVLFGVMLIIIAMVFVVRPWSRAVATVLASEVLIHHVVALCAFLFMKTKAVNSYQSFFLAGSRNGMAFQNIANCCGWNDVKYYVGDSCNYTIPCKTIIEKLFPGETLVLYSCIPGAIICDIVTVVMCIYLVYSSHTGRVVFETQNFQSRKVKSRWY